MVRGKERTNEEKRRERKEAGEEVSTNILRRGLFAILCIRDAHFYAFTFTGWKATSYSRERGWVGVCASDGGDGAWTGGGGRRLDVNLPSVFYFLFVLPYPSLVRVE